MRRRHPLGPSLHVLLSGYGPWKEHTQILRAVPVPTVVTRFIWPDVTMEQQCFAAVPESAGFWMRVKLTNTGNVSAHYRLIGLLNHVGEVIGKVNGLDQANGTPLLRWTCPEGVHAISSASHNESNVGQITWTVDVNAGTIKEFDVQICGSPSDWKNAWNSTASAWRKCLQGATRMTLPDERLQFASEACLRQVLLLVETRQDGDMRVLIGLCPQNDF